MFFVSGWQSYHRFIAVQKFPALLEETSDCTLFPFPKLYLLLMPHFPDKASRYAKESLSYHSHGS